MILHILEKKVACHYCLSFVTSSNERMPTSPWQISSGNPARVHNCWHAVCSSGGTVVGSTSASKSHTTPSSASVKVVASVKVFRNADNTAIAPRSRPAAALYRAPLRTPLSKQTCANSFASTSSSLPSRYPRSRMRDCVAALFCRIITSPLVESDWVPATRAAAARARA